MSMSGSRGPSRPRDSSGLSLVTGADDSSGAGPSGTDPSFALVLCYARSRPRFCGPFPSAAQRPAFRPFFGTAPHPRARPDTRRQHPGIAPASARHRPHRQTVAGRPSVARPPPKHPQKRPKWPTQSNLRRDPRGNPRRYRRSSRCPPLQPPPQRPPTRRCPRSAPFGLLIGRISTTSPDD
jgi:hypothetical protein